MFIIKEGTPADKVGEGTTPEVIASVTKFLEGQGLTVRNAAQDKTWSQGQIDQAFYVRNNQIEQTIKELTGIDPLQGEKYFDYLKRTVTEIKSKSGSGDNAEIVALKKKISDLEGSGGNATAIEEYKRQLETAQATAKTVREELEGKINKLNGEIFSGRVSGTVNGALTKDILPKLKKLDFQDEIIAARLARFEKENIASDFDGHIIFKKPDGTTHTSKKDGKPQSAAERLDEYFSDLYDKDRKQGGAGSGSEGGNAGGGAGGGADKPWKNINVDKAVIKNKQMLYKSLKDEHKLVEGSKDFNEAYAELSKDLPIR